MRAGRGGGAEIIRSVPTHLKVSVLSLTRFALTAASIALSLGAHAAPALSTIDADVLDASRCQSDSSVERSQYRLGGNRAHSNEYATNFSCGLGLNSQIGLEVRHLGGEGLHLNEQAVLGRTRLGRIGDSGPQITLLWGLARIDASGSDVKPSTSSRIGVAMSQDLGAGRLYGSVSHLGTERSGDVSEWRAGYQYRINDAFQLHYDVSGASNDKPTHTIGAAWNITPSAQIGLDLARHSLGYGATARSAMVTARFGF